MGRMKERGKGKRELEGTSAVNLMCYKSDCPV